MKIDFPKDYAVKNCVHNLCRLFRLEAPVDINSILEMTDMKLEYADFDDVSIRCVIDDEKIVFNKDYKVGDMTFMLAVCIGNIFLHKAVGKKYTDSPMYREGYSEEEYEAKLFAYELLMPEELYIKEIKKILYFGNDISDACKKFNASERLFKERGEFLGFKFSGD